VNLTQELLRAELDKRIRSAEDRGGAAAAETTTAVVVLRRFDLVPWIRGTVAFAAGLPGTEADAWRAAFTRTVFLAGNPDNLRNRFAFDHIGPGADAAWLAPAPAQRFMTLRRLLRLFAAPAALAPSRPETVDLDGPPTGDAHDLYIGTAGTSVSQTLIDLNHLLAEAVLDGLLRPGDRLHLRRVPRLVGLGPFDALRVVAEPEDPARLRAHAGLVRREEVHA
jgi:hypothetical protein